MVEEASKGRRGGEAPLKALDVERAQAPRGRAGGTGARRALRG